MTRCSTCIIPASYPDTTFESGVCGFCRNYGHASHINDHVLGVDRLVEILKSEHSGEYDCAVPVSGGKDSCYVLYYAVKKLGLKPLALFFDNGFSIDVATSNVEEICNTLGVDLVIGRATDYRRKLVKEALYASKYLGKFVRICGNCENNIRTFVINEAVKHNIPFILWGYTDFEEDSSYFTNENTLPHSKRYGTLSSVIWRINKTFRTVIRQRANLLNKARAVYYGMRNLYYGVLDNIATGTPEGLRKFNPFLEVSLEGKMVRSISFFDYIEYDPFGIVEILKRELNWRSPAERESRMDCMIHSLMNYQNWKDTGITRDGFTYAVLIRNGLLSREDALKKEEALLKDIERECIEFGEMMDVDIGDSPVCSRA